MGSKPTPPAPPDPVAISQAQSASNVNSATASARLSAVNQNSPYGTVTYDTIGNENIGGNQVPQYQQNITLSPAEQQKLDQTNQLTSQALTTAGQGLGNAQKTLSQPFDISGVPKLPGTGDFGAERQRVEDSLMSRFNQDFPRQQEDVISRLNAEGIQRGSAGYDVGMQGLERQQNDARNLAIQGGGAEQSRLFGLAGQAHQQGVSDAALVRNQPINEFATLLGLGGQVQQPNGAPNFGINVGQTDVTGAYGLQQQALQNNYNQRMQSNNAMWGALGNLGGAAGTAMLFSDVRLKNLIRRVGTTAKGIPLWLYTFKGSNKPVVGVLAQEVMRMIPEAVHERGGILHVDYARVG